MDQAHPNPGWGRRNARRLALLVAAVLVLAGLMSTRTEQPAADPAPAGGLPQINATSNYVTGISSGGYMATQLQVAHSSRFAGTAIFSAGPYWCALNSVTVALQSCTAYNVPTPMPVIYETTDRYEAEGKIDPLSNLASNPTYFFHGTLDPTVVRPVADNLADFYRHYGVPLTYRNELAAGHGWISPLGPVACAETAPPYINNCSPYDAQADSLRTMFGSVDAPNPGKPRGTLTAFDQNPYAVAPEPGNGDITRTGAPAIGMGGTGYVYTPNACAGGAPCKIVLALHGCQQTAEQMGDTFARNSGLNAYADTNNFVVLYPQARPDSGPAIFNPKGCWDWWGYLGPNDVDYATKLGPQMRTVMNMVEALGG
ncbi:MAG: PHB depolymerase family esterase [Actinomycetota bacterium]|nr:PHB depolymerase family esterase [Actinomycetota bacterium]